jgi:uncharacterized Ntn-hydrolase superfamily protein
MHTYSIVALDAETGDLGVAVQSHWFSVGSLCPWAQSGVGAVATQAMVNPAFGPDGLALLEEGKTAEQALETLLAADEGREMRQVAIVDAQGNVATHTGQKCIAEAGHRTGAGYSVQANMMLNDRVWPKMARAFEASQARSLPERLVAALFAAQEVGGDVRGKQSAALLVVRASPTNKSWADRIVDLRVEDHIEPVVELARLLRVQRAYDHMNRGDLAIEEGDTETALAEYEAAETLYPQNPEPTFWHAVSLANLGQIDEAVALFGKVYAQDPNWRTLAARLVAVDLLTVSDEDLVRIVS